MPGLTLRKAQRIVKAALDEAEKHGMKPLSVAVLDERGVARAVATQDGASLMRFDIAFGKAYGALGAGAGSRSLMKMALDRPHFMTAFVAASDGRCVPVPGGVLIKDSKGAVLGAVGVSGDTSDNDEVAAVAGITAAGLTADPGAG
jgi:uncharacterized protein GlcG (DUF336 family)